VPAESAIRIGQDVIEHTTRGQIDALEVLRSRR